MTQAAWNGYETMRRATAPAPGASPTPAFAPSRVLDPIRVVDEAVRAVLAGLFGASRPAARASSAATKGEPVFADRLFALRNAEALPADARSVRIAAGTVITPLARDLLKRRGIVVRLAGAADVAAAARGEWAFAVEPGAGWLDALRRSFLEDAGLWRELESSVDAIVEWLADGEGRGAILVTTDGATAVWRACRAHGVRAAFANEPADVHRATGTLGANLIVVDPAGKSIAWVKQLATAFRRAGAPRDLIAAEYEHEHQHQHERGTP
jgi:ribose 5-phosphate isomerase RpiB